MSEPLLRLEDVRAGYGSMPVLHGVDITVNEGEIAVILGANGVGKTTTLRTITGLLKASAGSIRFEGQELRKLPPEKIVRLGVGAVPAAPGVFRDMPVIDNLRVGGIALGNNRKKANERVERLLERFPILDQRQDQTAGSLSGGEQRMLAVARALVSDPKLLLVDEASMGLSPAMVGRVFALLDEVRREGITVCMVEQNISALDLADRVYVMEKGRVVHEATGDQLADARDEVARAYLGVGADA